MIASLSTTYNKLSITSRTSILIIFVITRNKIEVIVTTRLANIVTSIMMHVVASIITIYLVASIVFLKITTLNDIIIYETSFETQHKLQSIAKTFLIIWKNSNDIVNISKKSWISMKIIFETKSKSSRVYFVESQNRDFIDKKFDKLHNEKKMSWIIETTFFDFSIFVVWKTIQMSKKNSIRKNKIVIDIRDFNKIIESNNYFMLFQTNVINVVNDCFYVNVINAIDFFH